MTAAAVLVSAGPIDWTKVANRERRRRRACSRPGCGQTPTSMLVIRRQSGRLLTYVLCVDHGDTHVKDLNRYAA